MLFEKNRQGLLVFEKNGKIYLFWRSVGTSLPGIFCVESNDGKTFKKRSLLVSFFRADGTKTVLGSNPGLRASTLGAKVVLSFSSNEKQGVFAAIKRGDTWKTVLETPLFHGPTVALKIPAKNKKKGRLIAYSARNSRTIFWARSLSDLNHLNDMGDILEARRGAFDASALLPLYTALIPQGILLVYSAKNTTGKLTIGAAIFDHDRPRTLLWRSDHPLWEAPDHTPAETMILGGVNIGKYFYVYLQSRGKSVMRFPIARYWEAVVKKGHAGIILPRRKPGVRIRMERVQTNPVLEPITKNSWEAFATFNPAALFLDNRVHLLYRAQGYDGLSVLGYAASSDGIRIDERHDRPAFVPAQAQHSTGSAEKDNAFHPYVSGGGTSGCEDPRLVEINGRIYLIYVAFDGVHPPGVALSHIATSDFLAKRFRWSRPKLISQPGKIQKNWVLFPEKIGEKYAILHGLSPQIRIEYIDDPKELGDGKHIESLSSHGGGGYIEARRLDAWDNIVRGVGAPPLKTKYGWLVFYHGMDMRDPGKYKVGAMLLDLKHPEHILCRAVEPILEPDTEYENNGHKRGVVYVCGAIVKDEKLFVYYGAADRTSAVATADFETFLRDLRSNTAPVLRKRNIRKKT